MLEEIQLQQVLPQEIEKRSFEIITEELGNVELDPLQAPIIKRAIHTSADFDYLKNLTFSELAVEQFHTAIKMEPVLSRIRRWRNPASTRKNLRNTVVRSTAL